MLNKLTPTYGSDEFTVLGRSGNAVQIESSDVRQLTRRADHFKRFISSVEETVKSPSTFSMVGGIVALMNQVVSHRQTVILYQ